MIRYNSDRKVIDSQELYDNYKALEWYDAKVKKLVPVTEYNVLDPLDVVISSLRSAMVSVDYFDNGGCCRITY